MKVFWSWQSDHPPAISRDFVKGALRDALAIVADDLSLSEAERPDVDHDTKGQPGLVDIVSTIFKKIADASAFVADVTPVAGVSKAKEEGKEKLVPNPNVMIELGYAIGTIGTECIILVANQAFGGRPEDLPFDLRHRRGPITYKLTPGAKPSEIVTERKRLAKELASALGANLRTALASRDAEAAFSLHPASSSDAATWLEPTERIDHQAYHGGNGPPSSWTVSMGPKVYLRICPMAWGKKPTRAEVWGAPESVRLHAFGRWVNGDGGANRRGLVAVGLDPSQVGSVHAVTQWFDQTGEIWGFNAKLTSESVGRLIVAEHLVLNAWAEGLAAALKLFAHFGAQGPFRAEAGMTGLDDVYWPGGAAQALNGSAKFEFQGRNWDRQGQVEFLTGAVNALREAFNQAPREASEIDGYWSSRFQAPSES